MSTEHREQLAEYAHEAWTGWMSYLFSKCKHNEDGTMVIPKWAVDRWSRQACTDYTRLPDKEKESDRDEADKMLAIVGANRMPEETCVWERSRYTNESIYHEAACGQGLFRDITDYCGGCGRKVEVKP